jgi:uncharacterized membrane protein (UPF0127 family)
VRSITTVAIVLALLTAAACAGTAEPAPSPHQIAKATFRTSSGDAATSFLEVADSEEEREHGLMGRQRLDRDSGMVFEFDAPTRSGFWMKDTLIPLSIAFWGKGKTVLDILEMDPCTADPCPTYAPEAPYTYALEMNAGWFTDHGIEIGDRVELTLATE